MRDLVSTLVVEAAIHHLDLLLELDRPAPRPEVIATTRRTLDYLLGMVTPADWDGVQWVRAATGRGPLTDEQRRVLGADVRRLPLLS